MTESAEQQLQDALLNVYVIAARLRTFPVPFDDHFALVGAVDECRSVMESPIFDDPFALAAAVDEGRSVMAPPIDDAPGTIAPEEVSGGQARGDACPREEFLAAFQEANAALQQLWTAQVGKEGYDKELWKTVANTLSRFARDAAEKVGIPRTEPLL